MRRVGRRGGAKPDDTLWWSPRFLIQRADLRPLRDLHSNLVRSRTRSRLRGEVEDEITRSIRLMSQSGEWREVCKPFFDQIGEACDRIAAAGYPEAAQALAAHTRERRGVIGRLSWPGEQARHIMRLADEAERLAAKLKAQA